MNVSQLTDEQTKVFNQFKEQVESLQLRDITLFRWLKAADFSPAKAREMLVKSLEWRRTNGVDNILGQESLQDLAERFPVAFLDTDKDNCLVTVEQLRGKDDSVSATDRLRYFIYVTEKSIAKMDELSHNNEPITQLTCILDMQHKELDTQSLDLLTESSKILEANYPNIVKRTYIVNAPKYSRTLFWASGDDRCRVFGGNKAKWIKVLQDDIGADALPKFYGGSKEIEFGPRIECDMEFWRLPSSKEERKKTFTLSANDILGWNILVERGNVGFRIYYLEARKKVEVASIPALKHLVLDKGSIVCPKSAEYVFQLRTGWFPGKVFLWRSIQIERQATGTQP